MFGSSPRRRTRTLVRPRSLCLRKVFAHNVPELPRGLRLFIAAGSCSTTNLPGAAYRSSRARSRARQPASCMARQEAVLGQSGRATRLGFAATMSRHWLMLQRTGRRLLLRRRIALGARSLECFRHPGLDWQKFSNDSRYCVHRVDHCAVTPARPQPRWAGTTVRSANSLK